MRKFLLAAIAAAITLPVIPVSTASAQSRQEWREDWREFRQDRRGDRREFRQERRQDRRAYFRDWRGDRRDYRQGASRYRRHPRHPGIRLAGLIRRRRPPFIGLTTGAIS